MTTISKAHITNPAPSIIDEYPDDGTRLSPNNGVQHNHLNQGGDFNENPRLLHRELNKYMRPALLAGNDSRFDEKDYTSMTHLPHASKDKMEVDPNRADCSLFEQINQLPQLDAQFSFGKDIDGIHETIFTEDVSQIEKTFREWASRKQPCVFGRLASKKKISLDYHITIVNNIETMGNESKLSEYLKAERLLFKKRALEGEVSAHVIYFIHPKLAYARPSQEFMAFQKRICGLHMPEFYPVMEDVIYTESVPYRDPQGIKIYKAGANVFYSSAHGTYNHDRRVPGGILISVNAPGHFMRLALNKKIYTNEYQALNDIKKMTKKSVGCGGIEHCRKISSTWHSIKKTNRDGRLVAEKDEESAYYSGFYHADILIPGELTCNGKALEYKDPHDPMIFDWNVLFYVSLEDLSLGDPYYGEFIGISVNEDEVFSNPFAARGFKNGPLSSKKGSYDKSSPLQLFKMMLLPTIIILSICVLKKL